MKQATVLYVEDNEYNRKIVRQLLRRTPYRLLEAPDGEAGARDGARRSRPDLILMDVQLPKMSGLEATRMLRGEAATADHARHHGHLVRAERRRPAGDGGRRLRLPREAVQPARAARR